MLTNSFVLLPKIAILLSPFYLYLCSFCSLIEKKELYLIQYQQGNFNCWLSYSLKWSYNNSSAFFVHMTLFAICNAYDSNFEQKHAQIVSSKIFKIFWHGCYYSTLKHEHFACSSFMFHDVQLCTKLKVFPKVIWKC